MKVLIIEDEPPAAKQLEKLLHERRSSIQVLEVLDSIESAVRWFRAPQPLQLIFMDIQLADGLSFDIFQQAVIDAPVIFTTAYDQFTLRAFKVNSVDYLLKPIDPQELERALLKYENVFQPRITYDPQLIDQLIATVSQPSYKERFLIKAGQHISYVPVSDIRYFYSDGGLVFAQTGTTKKHPLDYTLDQLQELISPAQFFRLNRKAIVSVEAIRKIAPYFNSRLILELQPPPDFDVIVSRDRVSDFKRWLDR